jgi:GDPmannose 4,6-dehydratase
MTVRRKKAFITGIAGQDGSYLAELLLEKGYEVHGMIRRSSSVGNWRLEHIYENPQLQGKHFFLHYGDVMDASCLNMLLDLVQPDEVYHLAAQSHVRVSFDMPEYTGDVSGLGTLRLLEALKHAKRPVKFYNAATSEMFGNAPQLPITEKTPFRPCSPYANAKLFSYWTTVNYREAYDMFACSGILFNHESPRRGETFVTRKIIRAFHRIAAGKDDVILLGNLDAKRDWGFAPEYVHGMWLMLQQEKADDYVLATGEAHSVREFVEEASGYFGLSVKWDGSGIDEVGKDAKTGKVIVKVSKRYFRPTEVHHLLGDAKKAKHVLGWTPKTKFSQLVKIMAEAEMKLPIPTHDEHR